MKMNREKYEKLRSQCIKVAIKFLKFSEEMDLGIFFNEITKEVRLDYSIYSCYYEDKVGDVCLCATEDMHYYPLNAIEFGRDLYVEIRQLFKI